MAILGYVIEWGRHLEGDVYTPGVVVAVYEGDFYPIDMEEVWGVSWPAKDSTIAIGPFQSMGEARRVREVLQEDQRTWGKGLSVETLFALFCLEGR